MSETISSATVEFSPLPGSAQTLSDEIIDNHSKNINNELIEEIVRLKVELQSMSHQNKRLTRFVESATKWQKRSWFKRAFHRWRPKEDAQMPMLTDESGARVSLKSLAAIIEPNEKENLEDKIAQSIPSSNSVIDVLVKKASTVSIEEIHGFNQRERDRWVIAKAKTVSSGARVLDVGAGTCLYKKYFAHCDYKAHDFKEYEGYQDSREGLYGTIDFVSDITSIPVEDCSFDVILCTEVLEHVPEPIASLREMARILKPGGRIFLTAPAMSGLHQLPYHFYSGYTPYWYQHFCGKFAIKISEITPNGGFFKLLAQECARVAWTMPIHEELHGQDKETIGTLFGEILPKFLFALEDECFIDQFTVGYHVEGVKQ